MYILKTHTVLGDYETKFLTSCEIKSNWSDLTDTAQITFPKRIIDQDRKLINDGNALFKVGDPVSLDGWYKDYKDSKRFEGFISNVSPRLPVVIECEDAMFLMKQFSFTKGWGSVSLETLVAYVFDQGGASLDGYSYQILANVQLGQFLIENGTGAQVFGEIKKTYGLNTYVKDKVFYIGFTYEQEIDEIPEIVFERDIISDDMVYRREEDVRLKVKAVSIDGANKKIEVELGDPNGEQRTLHYFNLDEATLRQTAQNDLEKYKYTGWRGSFETFLHPTIRHSQKIRITSSELPERNGVYYVSQVVTSYGVGGGRQRVELDRASILDL